MKIKEVESSLTYTQTEDLGFKALGLLHCEIAYNEADDFLTSDNAARV